MLQGQSTKAQDPGAWATGIVEVALPVEYKMKNIEETEAAKRRLLHASRHDFFSCVMHDARLNLLHACATAQEDVVMHYAQHGYAFATPWGCIGLNITKTAWIAPYLKAPAQA